MLRERCSKWCGAGGVVVLLSALLLAAADLLWRLGRPPLRWDVGAVRSRGRVEEAGQHVQLLHILLASSTRSHAALRSRVVHPPCVRVWCVRVRRAVWTLGMVSCSTTCARQARMDDSREHSTDGALKRNHSTADVGGPAKDSDGHHTEQVDGHRSTTAHARPSTSRTAAAQHTTGAELASAD